MYPHHPIPLYPNPPYTQDEFLSDASSDFPPIRVCESSPAPPVCSINPSGLCFLTAQEKLEQPSLSKSAPQSSRHSQRLNKGHRSKSVHKTDEMTARDAKVGRASNLADSYSNYLFDRHISEPRQSKAAILISMVALQKRVVSLLLKYMTWSG